MTPLTEQFFTKICHLKRTFSSGTTFWPLFPLTLNQSSVVIIVHVAVNPQGPEMHLQMLADVQSVSQWVTVALTWINRLGVMFSKNITDSLHFLSRPVPKASRALVHFAAVFFVLFVCFFSGAQEIWLVLFCQRDLASLDLTTEMLLGWGRSELKGWNYTKR